MWCAAFAAILPEYPESLGEIESAVSMLVLPRLPKVGWVRTQLGQKVLPEFTVLVRLALAVLMTTLRSLPAVALLLGTTRNLSESQ